MSAHTQICNHPHMHLLVAHVQHVIIVANASTCSQHIHNLTGTREEDNDTVKDQSNVNHPMWEAEDELVGLRHQVEVMAAKQKQTDAQVQDIMSLTCKLRHASPCTRGSVNIPSPSPPKRMP